MAVTRIGSARERYTLIFLRCCFASRKLKIGDTSGYEGDDKNSSIGDFVLEMFTPWSPQLPVSNVLEPVTRRETYATPEIPVLSPITLQQKPVTQRETYATPEIPVLSPITLQQELVWSPVTLQRYFDNSPEMPITTRLYYTPPEILVTVAQLPLFALQESPWNTPATTQYCWILMWARMKAIPRYPLMKPLMKPLMIQTV
ncbi:hypothetical protein KP79_PYT01458 [Mizuhopecten yessoensis]|uniref:Uncharacterized protein n=1 Tax=Mizuhopecten yessoensis TaxID=6573 RepID=A0A210QBN9_MIZYE|nr:hypothetical protein KP79_PYT01458 [Mizuhopecten yessoensis]